jgi:hypothetical protein
MFGRKLNPLQALDAVEARKNNPQRGRGVRILFVAFVVACIAAVGRMPQSDRMPTEQKAAQAPGELTAEQKAAPAPVELTAEQKAAKAKKAAEEKQWITEVLLLRALRDNLKNPDSFKLVEAVRVGTTLCLTYRGTNSFNATILERAVIDTKTTGASTDAGAWNKHCAGKQGTDISYIRHAI